MKRHRTYASPPGALAEMRNPRLYGSRDEQIEGLALRSRGITGRVAPDPDRPRDVSADPVVRAPRTELANTPAAHARRVAKAYGRMTEAQGIARDARMRGDKAALAAAAERARELRHEYLSLTGELPQSRPIELAAASDANKVKAAA